VGFWRGVGYFFSAIIIIIGLIFFPIGLIGVAIGLIFIWLLRNSARSERMEKILKDIRYNSSTEEQRKKLKYEEDPDHCVNCGKYMLWDNTKPLCGKCRKLERLERDREIVDRDIERKLDEDRKKLAELESEKHLRNIDDKDRGEISK
jgi:hypothetical protein